MDKLISVIVAVKNRRKDIKKLLNSLVSQSYQNFEVIIVDNGSTDGTVELLKQLPPKFVFLDGSHLQPSPYLARNLGIKKAKGDIIAFVDGYPTNEWLSEGVKCMENLSLDLVAGKIELEPRSSDIYEIYDSIFYLDVKNTVKKYNRAPTGNLLVCRKVFDTIGLFDESARSGSDMIFTSEAVKNGFNLSFCNEMLSKYYCRDKLGVINKNKRIALNQPNIWRAEKKEAQYLTKAIIKMFIPINYLSCYRYINERSSSKLSFKSKTTLLYIHNKLRIESCYYNIVGYFRMRYSHEDI